MNILAKRYKDQLLQYVGEVTQQSRISNLKSKAPKSKGRPLVVGLLSTPSGLGNGARLILEGLESAGLKPSFQDITSYFDGHVSSVRLPQTRPDDQVGPVTLHVNPVELAYIIDRGIIPNLENRYRVGVWAWEQSTSPKKWCEMALWIDENWGSSTFLTAIFQAQIEKPAYYVRYPCALFNSGDQRVASSFPRKPSQFKILTKFSSLSSVERKNPAGAIDTFLKAFPNDPNVSMTIHSSSTLNLLERESLQCDPRIIVIDAPLTDKDLNALLKSHDVFLSLHRAEGFGLSIARALALGIPAIFTDHSGASDFTKSPLAYGVKYEPVPVNKKNIHYKQKYGPWAEPNIDQAVSMLLEISDLPPEEREILSMKAVDWWEKEFGIDDFIRRLDFTAFSSRLKTT